MTEKDKVIQDQRRIIDSYTDVLARIESKIANLKILTEGTIAGSIVSDIEEILRGN